MSLIHDAESITVTDFPGADLLRDVEDVPRHPPGASVAKNVEFPSLGEVSTRRGFAQMFNPSLQIERFFNWITGSFNRLLMFSRNGASAPKVRYRQLDTAAEADIITGLNVNTTNAVFAQFGSRAFMAFLDANGAGVDNAKVWNGLFTGVAEVDDLFQAPLVDTSNYTVGFSEPLTGVVTAGVHKLGVVWHTRNGYVTKADAFNTNFTATGGMSLRVTLTPVGTWPQWVRFAEIIMTTVQNKELYMFVPNSKEAVSQGTSTPVTIDIDIDDTTLAGLGSASEATEYFNLLSSTAAGAPIKAKYLVEYSNRMVYIADLPDAISVSPAVSHIFVSDPGQPQWITGDQHVVFLPGYRQAVCAFVLSNTVYILGPGWTFAFTDNLEKPVLWAKAITVDLQKGTQSPHGAAVNTSGSMAWVAHTDGLYAFRGYYSTLPASFLQSPDWDRINWAAAAGSVQVQDDSDNETVHVLAPLDGATVPTHILTWDYKAGTEWHQVKYSIDNIASVNPGAIGLVFNPTKKLFELALSNSAAGKVYRRKSTQAGDASLYNDDSAAIDSQYRTQPMPAVAQAPMQHMGMHVRVKGSGALAVTAYNANEARSQDLGDITAAASPEADEFLLVNEQSEAVLLDITNKNTANSFFSMSRVISYFMPWLERR